VTARSAVLPLAAFGLAAAVIVVGIKLLLRVPGVPYNVSSLFLDNASVPALGFFAVAVLWIGAGAAVVVFVVTNSRRPYVVLPLALVLVALVSKALVSRGATYESLDDILGSNNMFGLVTAQRIWGEWWRSAFLRIGIDTVEFMERRVRYCALYSIPLLAIAAGSFWRAPQRRHTMSRAVLLSTGAVAALWLWLSSAIVVTMAATDNLTELIAAPGPFAIPGEFYVLALLALMAANVELLVRAVRSVTRWSWAVVGSGAGVALSWLLLNAGLEQHVHKYSIVFSATEFLLGPDRQHALSRAVLFGRWAVVYVAAVVAIAIGVWLGEVLIERVRTTSRRSAAPEAS
jgi:hypothetical protein